MWSYKFERKILVLLEEEILPKNSNHYMLSKIWILLRYLYRFRGGCSPRYSLKNTKEHSILRNLTRSLFRLKKKMSIFKYMTINTLTLSSIMEKKTYMK